MAINYRPITPTSYVAFTKATEAIWAKMNPSQRLDNTLYFIVDSAEDTIGKLYLGNTLIADGGGLTSLALGDLSDVVYEAIQAGDILMYDMVTGKWKNTNFAKEVGDLIKVFKGATETEDGLAGLVPQPISANGDLNKYLKGDGTWSNPTEVLEQSVGNLQSQVTVLIGDDVNLSVKTIATDVAHQVARDYYDVILNKAPETLDTLGEIAEWIQSHPAVDDVLEVINRVGVLETSVEGLIPQVNTLKTDLNNVTESLNGLKNNFDVLELNHNNLNALVTQLQSSIADNKEDIEDILSRLMWQELFEEEEDI